MKNIFIRTEMIMGEEKMRSLRESKVAVCGIGGVGSYAAEALVRCGVGSIKIIDHDFIAESNINRQIHADIRTVGMLKTEAMKSRMLDINPEARVTSCELFLTHENIPDIIGEDFDYIIDAIDTVTAKIALAVYATNKKVPIISCMGTGNKFRPEKLELADIYSTDICPLAKVMRKELRKRNIPQLLVCYSKEKPVTPGAIGDVEPTQKRQTPGSVSFVPSVAGLIIAGKVIRDITGIVD